MQNATADATDATDAPLFAGNNSRNNLASFASTRDQAANVAAAQVGRRYRQIIEILAAAPDGECIFEVAAVLGCFDYQISGRFGELEKLGLIRKAGHRRTKPTTGCQAEVYEITP